MNKKGFIISIFLAVAILTTSIGVVMARPFYKIRSIEKTYNMLYVETHYDLLLIDVRPTTGPAIAYEFGHIPGAFSVPMGDLSAWIEGEGQNHLNDKIIVNCWLGSLSLGAAQMLIDAGFKKVYSLEGGFSAWDNAGYPVATGL